MTQPPVSKPPVSKPPCPTCGKPADPAARPFCSKRCADIDLQRWLSGRYAVPATEDQEGPSDPAPDDD